MRQIFGRLLQSQRQNKLATAPKLIIVSQIPAKVIGYSLANTQTYAVGALVHLLAHDIFSFEEHLE